MASETTDVLVLGSGGAALLAACAAAEGGARVTLVERTSVLGGTTAVSGGMLWVGNNSLAERIGIHDSRDDTLTYLDRVTRGEVPRLRLESFVDTGPELVRYLDTQTPVGLFPIDRPDYHSAWPGAKLGGRVLDNLPFATAQHPGVDALVREGPHFPPLTYEERHRWRSPERFDQELIATRRAEGIRTLGGALVAGLVAAAVERGVELVTGTRAEGLVERDGRIRGARGSSGSGVRTWEASRGVVLASGGYEWNESLRRAFLRGPGIAAASPPWNLGDGLLMALRAGAAVTNMGEAWWAPMYQIPGERYDGEQVTRHMIDELSLPGSVLVNRAGHRFVNESTNYNDLSKMFHVFDPGPYDYVNVPSWLVFDQRFKSSYPVATVAPSAAAPDWFHASSSLEELATSIGVDPAGLTDTVRRFNAHARAGHDPDLGRGSGALDLYYGDDEHGPNPCLGELTTPPFYAVEILPGLLGTKGGVVTDPDGRVVDPAGAPIPGLYACSNVTASPVGPGYPGAGGSLGPMLVDALRCGRALARSTAGAS